MSELKFTPLSGAHDDGPLCSILQIEDFTILLDCGWDDRFNTADAHIQKLKEYVHNDEQPAGKSIKI